MTPEITNFNVVNLAPSFQNRPAKNRLFQNLGIFQFRPSDTAKVSFDYLVEQSLGIAEAKARFGSEWNSTKQTKASLMQVEMAYFPMLNTVTAADWQGLRVVGGDRQMDPTDVTVKYAQQHNDVLLDTIEKYMADSVLRGINYAPYTQQEVINYQTETGLAIQTLDIDLSVASVNIDSYTDEIHTKMREALQDKQRYLNKVVCLCGSGFYKKFKATQAFRDSFVYVQPYDLNNMIHQYREILPNIQYFEYNNIVFIMDTDVNHGIGTNEAYFVPQLDSSSGIFVHHGGPLSRHQGLAASLRSGDKYFQYQLIDPKFGGIDVCAEMSLLCSNMSPNVTIKSTHTGA